MGWDNKYIKIFIHAQCLHKMSKKLGYWVLRPILFTSSAALQQQRLARTERNFVMSVKTKHKRRSRPTRRTKTLGVSEDFYVLLVRPSFSSFALTGKAELRFFIGLSIWAQGC